MSEALERLRSLNRHEEKLDGIVFGYHLPDITECLLAGDVPLPALNKLPTQASDTDAEALVDETGTAELARANIAFKKRLVAAMLDDIDGAYIGPEDDRAAIVDALTPVQRETLFELATREKDPNSGEA